MSLQEWADWAQIAIAIATATGVIVSIRIAERTLREVQSDRRLRQAPYLMFETGANVVPIKFVKRGAAVPGISPPAAKKAFSAQGAQVESIHIDAERAGSWTWGQLRNLGVGPATHVMTVWVAHRINVGDESFRIDAGKRAEPIYDPNFNALPPLPRAISAQSDGELSRLPTFIVRDTEKKLSHVQGTVMIECLDVFGEAHIFLQEFRLWTSYHDEKPTVQVTFGNMARADEVFGEEKTYMLQLAKRRQRLILGDSEDETEKRTGASP